MRLDLSNRSELEIHTPLELNIQRMFEAIGERDMA